MLEVDGVERWELGDGAEVGRAGQVHLRESDVNEDALLHAGPSRARGITQHRRRHGDDASHADSLPIDRIRERLLEISERQHLRVWLRHIPKS